MKKISIALATLALAALAACSVEPTEEETVGTAEQELGKLKKLDAPFLIFDHQNPDNSLTFLACAGASGAPGGITVQWAKASEFGPRGQWPSERSCDEGFSHKSHAIAPESCIPVTVGVAQPDTVSLCTIGLECGTVYKFRAFAHATKTANKSNIGPLADYGTTTPCQ